MKQENKKQDDHHCSVIERGHLQNDLSECDANSKSEEDRDKCHVKSKEASKKREQACKHS
ncbi:MAG: hypothetical protein KKE44_20920 [Proteobacteria bacterium]|nr:hypothetical protein [Pseudomonadota bacterium]MBU1585195.1 hypothetical protein [Pseudomonadota bacterium]MBU2454508.1 hypothetical protein [Pseudomonadota bacterium]MBU2629085.1 hypothetical protein [Pseudomonadota bacterium]